MKLKTMLKSIKRLINSTDKQDSDFGFAILGFVLTYLSDTEKKYLMNTLEEAG